MLNHVVVQGRLGGPAEISELPNSGGRVARMRVAHRESWKKDDEWKERVSWLTVITFREGLIDNVIKPKALKGAQVILTGKLQDNSYKDNDGVFHEKIEIVIGPGHQLQLIPKEAAAADSRQDTGDDPGGDDPAPAAGDQAPAAASGG